MGKFKAYRESEKSIKNFHTGSELERKMKFYKSKGFVVPSMKLIKNAEQINAIRESGKINIAVLDSVSEYIEKGVSTEEIDELVYRRTRELGGIPAQLGYEGFPKSVCTSVNDQVCHGIPSKDCVLKDGDIINVDVSTIYNGYFSDSSRMFCIGNINKDAKKIVKVVRECVELGIRQAKPWGFLGDIGQAVNDHAKKNGCSVVREIGGHGVGLEFHEDPWVSFVSKAGTGMVMVPGFIFTIEPMVNLGRKEIYIDEENGWTVYTEDGSLSAQCEVMVLITENGNEILAY